MLCSLKPRYVLVVATVLAIPTLTLPPLHAAEADYRFGWVRTFLGPCCGDAGQDLEVDAEGGVLVAGHRGGLDLDRDGTVDVDTHGSPDSLVFKSWDDGREGWVHGPGGPGPDSAAAIAADGSGGAYVVGTFVERLHIPGSRPGDSELLAAGESDGYLVRYDRDGKALWSRPIGGEGSERMFDVAVDAKGNVYVVGTVRGAVDVDRDGTIDIEVPAEAGAAAAMVASFDARGTLRWVVASRDDSAALVQAIAIGADDAIFVGGSYRNGRLDLDGDGTADAPATSPQSGASASVRDDGNGFVARLDSSGSMVWFQPVTGPALQVVGRMATAENGDLLVLGAHAGAVDFGDDDTLDVDYREPEEERRVFGAPINSFLARMTPSGEVRWARRYVAQAAHVATHGSRIVVSGGYAGTLDLDDDGEPERSADGDEWIEGFAAILGEGGDIEHVFTVVGDDSDIVNAAAFTPDGERLYVTGYVKLSADFDADGRPENSSACHQLGDAYLAVYEVPVAADR